ncbi:DGQHR domain-containing protein [Acidovorax sp.]|uniref:DGQHR domain-containing protein n=1 Tax=Acidovorax sp. TaxID=1872122 RepID=UPI00391F7C76
MRTIRLPVLSLKQPIGEFFSASISARDLVEISYSDVRRLADEERDFERYLGIQRPLTKKRVKEIREYIHSDDASFPTAVILAVEERCAEFEEGDRNTGFLTLRGSELGDTDEESSPWGKSAKVIDGQHRIAGFLDESTKEYSFHREFDINVSIFVGADVSEQANIFATVNLAQTKVNTSLVYDLTELAKTRSPQKTCHNVAVALDKEKSSPLYRRIKRLGTATPGRTKEPLTQAAFVESLVKFISTNPSKDRNELLSGKKLSKAGATDLKKCPFRNLFIEEKEVDITEIIYNYFRAIERKWPTAWKDKDRVGNLLPRSNAFKALMEYLREDLYPQLAGGIYGRIPTSDEFFRALAHVDATDSDFTKRNFAPGGGGQAQFLKLLRGKISIYDLLE